MSYLPGGDGATYNDGRLGSAMIQEYQFNKYCMRLQALMAPVFDKEFKQYLKASGLAIDENLFDLQFNPPQNFAKYRQIEIDAAQIGVYAQVADNKRLAERFKLTRFLNLTEEELLENERMWAEENPSKVKAATGATEMGSGGNGGLSDVGIRSDGGEEDFELEMDQDDAESIGDEETGDTAGTENTLDQVDTSDETEGL